MDRAEAATFRRIMLASAGGFAVILTVGSPPIIAGVASLGLVASLFGAVVFPSKETMKTLQSRRMDAIEGAKRDG